MATKAKTAPLLSSNKDNLKKNAELLPVKPVDKPVEPVKPVNQDPEIKALVEQIKATGFLKNIFCNGFDFVLIRTNKSRLSVDEKVMLEDPLNRLEVKLLEMLPEMIRKQADKGGPIIELIAAVGMITWTKSQELKAKQPPAQDKPVEPVKPAGPASPFNPTAIIPEEKVNLN